MPRRRLTPLQCKILSAMWELGPATVGEIQEALSDDHLRTTIATLLTRLERDGVVTHEVERGNNIYRVLVRRDPIRRTMVSDLTNSLFRGSPEELLHHLVNDTVKDPQELQKLMKVIRARLKEIGE